MAILIGIISLVNVMDSSLKLMYGSRRGSKLRDSLLFFVEK